MGGEGESPPPGSVCDKAAVGLKAALPLTSGALSVPGAGGYHRASLCPGRRMRSTLVWVGRGPCN